MHSLFCGTTESGKTTLARFFSRRLLSEGQPVVVYDPMGTKTNGGDWGRSANELNLRVFRDEAKFWEYMADDRVINCHVFIDESDELFNHSRRENYWLLTRGRHFGLSINLICQRPNQIHPTVRRQCTRLYMFRLAVSDRDEIGKDYGHSDFRAYDFDGGEFLIANSNRRETNRANVHNLIGAAKS